MSEPLWRVEQADCVDLLTAMEPESVDCVITDPAYESLEKHRSHGTTTRLERWFEVFDNRRYPSLLLQMWRVLKPKRHAWIMCDRETEHLLTELAEATGFYVWNSFIWVKTRGAFDDVVEELTPSDLRSGMGYHGRRCHERILFLEKRTVAYSGLRLDPLMPRLDPSGEGRSLFMNPPDVLTGPKAGPHDYPTEKPLSVLLPLVNASVAPGEVVVDPFAGSGSTGAAVLEAGGGRRVILGDTSDHAISYMTRRFYSPPEVERRVAEVAR